MVAKEWAKDQEVDLKQSVCLIAGKAVKSKSLYISVPAGNAIQAFGYGADNTQNKNMTVPVTSSTTKMDYTSEPPFVTIPKVIGLLKFAALHEMLHV